MLKYQKTMVEKAIEKQKAFDYCVYMMLSSYFTRVRCTTRVAETRLFLYYKELGDRAAVEMEVEALESIERFILPYIPAEKTGEDAQVRILPWDEQRRCHGVEIRTGKLVITTYIRKDGKEKVIVFAVKECLNDGQMKSLTNAEVIGNRVKIIT